MQRPLDRAAVEFVNDIGNVRVERERRTMMLSSIFKGYGNDIVNHMVALDRLAKNGLLDYLGAVAEDSLCSVI